MHDINEFTEAGSQPVLPSHPGKYVRDNVLTPRKLSVIDAAKLVGVGRPAFSNFLNGNAATTPEMASRIEVAFSISAQQLLDMQTAYDAAKAKAKGTPTDATPYVAPFLSITANAIEQWANENISARQRLSVFLRILANSTCKEITKIDFPGNDDSERHGWDGHIEAAKPTPWIPVGVSGWEFGTNKVVLTKANKDYAQRTASTDKSERDRTTFIFVTPRRWKEKNTWAREKQSEGQWNDVRAYDSSDLEQWLEQSIAAQAWFANETEQNSDGVSTLDTCWENWSAATNPPLSGSLFTTAINESRRTIVSRLANAPEEPIVIGADSIEEALAFLAQLFGPAGGKDLEKYRDRVLTFREPGVLAKLAKGAKDFIAVAETREVENELGPFASRMHTVVIYPRNAATVTPDVVLQPLNFEAFENSLEEMQLSKSDIKKLNAESGRSLTVLRRRLAKVPAVKKPEWAKNHDTATGLIPILFAGAWATTNAADLDALASLSNGSTYEELEQLCQKYTVVNDPPIWSAGIYRGVVSKIDLLFAIAEAMTAKDLQRYFDVAKKILEEDDPQLDLPEGKRWQASLKGKVRSYSAVLRKGISESLVLLAVHGNHLFQSRLGLDCEASVNRLVRQVLTPFKTRVLEANQRDLMAYAEAAPDVFLQILEDDLESESPETYGILRPATTGILGEGCPRSELLWALEGLAWSPDTFLRVVLVLAKLSTIEINDNWANKPISSLQSIFRAWMPQTSVGHEARISAIKLLSRKYPSIAWQICIAQLGFGSDIGHYSHKPNWRNDGHGYGEPLAMRAPINAFIKDIVELMLSWPEGYTRERLGDLTQRIYHFSEEHRNKVWELIKTWANGDASDYEKALMYEHMRRTVMSRGAAMHGKSDEFKKVAAEYKSVAQSLESKDILNKHLWLFNDSWVELSADEIFGAEYDVMEREERVEKLRTAALQEIVKERGFEGIFRLSEMGNAGAQIGGILAKEVLNADDVRTLVLEAMEDGKGMAHSTRDYFIRGVFAGIDNEKNQVELLEFAKQKLPNAKFLNLLLLAPFRRSIWNIVDNLDEQSRFRYWNDVYPRFIFSSEIENNEAVERLLRVKRPRAAFTCVYIKLEILDPELLFRVMADMVKDGEDKQGEYQLSHHHIEKAFELIHKAPSFTVEQKAALELSYVDVLAKPWSYRGVSLIPNLEQYINEHPDFFAAAIVWAYKRKGGGQDPDEWRVAPEHVQIYAERGYKLLDGLESCPGRDELGEVSINRLNSWIKSVRNICTELDRLESADYWIGKLLAGPSLGKDNVWPCEPVRDALEEFRSMKMMNGAFIRLYNARGVTWRGEGGGQERELAEKFRGWAKALQYSHPFVSSRLLMEMVKTYEKEAKQEDAEIEIRNRLH